MAKVDPEALMREADELARKAGMLPEDPEADTQQEDPEQSPAPQADTDEDDQQENVEDAEDRGDPDASDDGDEEGFVSIERYKNAQAAMTKAQQEAAGLRRQVEDLRAENERLRASGETDNGVKDAGDAEAEINSLMEEYPEIAGPLLKKLSALETTVKSHTEAADRKKQDDATEAHLSAIRAKHSDLDTIIEDPDFNGWVARQTPTWQRVAEAGTADEVIELLDRYKAAMGLNEDPEQDPTPQRESAVERARKVAEPKLPRSRKPDKNARKKIWSRKEIAAMSLGDYEKHRDDIDRAYIEGRVR
jgi:hypothetical protein